MGVCISGFEEPEEDVLSIVSGRIQFIAGWDSYLLAGDIYVSRVGLGVAKLTDSFRYLFVSDLVPRIPSLSDQISRGRDKLSENRASSRKEQGQG